MNTSVQHTIYLTMKTLIKVLQVLCKVYERRAFILLTSGNFVFIVTETLLLQLLLQLKSNFDEKTHSTHTEQEKKIHFTKQQKLGHFHAKKNQPPLKSLDNRKQFLVKKNLIPIPPRISYYYAKSLMIQKLLCCEKFIKTVNQNYPPTIQFFCSF